MKYKKILLVIIIIGLLVLIFLTGKYFIEHQTGYGAVDYVNTNVPNGLLFVEKSEIPENLLVKPDYQNIKQVGQMFSTQFYCQNLEKDAEIIEYWKQTAGYGIVGGWANRYAVICGNEYLIVDDADYFGEKIYGPFNLDL
ncbi:MAG: hypothetical protein V1664_01625 [Candidatus Uhrbacteria bacterium]